MHGQDIPHYSLPYTIRGTGRYSRCGTWIFLGLVDRTTGASDHVSVGIATARQTYERGIMRCMYVKCFHTCRKPSSRLLFVGSDAARLTSGTNWELGAWAWVWVWLHDLAQVRSVKAPTKPDAELLQLLLVRGRSVYESFRGGLV